MPQTFLDKGMRTLFFAEANIPALPKAIPVATATGATAINMSDLLVVDTSTFQQDSSDSETERVYSNPGKVDIPTLLNGSGTGVYRRVFTALGAADVTDPLKYFNARQLGMHLFFTGQGVNDVPVVGDEYWYIVLRADTCMPDNKPTGGYAKLTVGFKFGGDLGFGTIAA